MRTSETIALLDKIGPEHRITQEVRAMAEAYDQAVGECERLRTENDQLRKGLESAISRISHWADIAGERGEGIDRLRDENERLREELHDAHMLANAISHKGTEDALRGKE